jgi:hypothetical protein
MSNINSEVVEDSHRQPVWHVIVLNIFVPYLYGAWWFYKNWKALASAAKEVQEKPELRPFFNTSPVLRTMGMMVPLLNIYLAFRFFKDIASIYPFQTAPQRKHPSLAAFLLTVALFGLLLLGKLPDGYYLFYLTACLPLALCQKWLNDYWQSKEESTLSVRQTFTALELTALILGAALLGLIVTHLMAL